MGGKKRINVFSRVLFIFTFFILCNFLYLPQLVAASGDGFDSAFSDLEDKKKEEANKKETPFDLFFKELIQNFNTSLDTNFFYYIKDVPYTSDLEKKYKDTNKLIFDEKFQYKTQIKRGNNFLATSGWLQLGTQLDTYYGITNSVTENTRFRRIHEISELYYVYSFPKVDLSLGKKVIHNGVSPTMSPADRISPTDWNDPLHPVPLGIIYASMDIYTDTININGTFLPFFVPSKYPSLLSRWVPPGNEVVTNYTQRGVLKQYAGDNVFDSDYPKISAQNFQYLLKLQSSTLLTNWDIYLSGFYGGSYYSPLHVDTKSISSTEAAKNAADCQGSECLSRTDEPATRTYNLLDYPHVWNFATGFSTTQGILEIHGETLYQISERGENYLAKIVQKDDDYLTYRGGIILNLSEWTQYIFLTEFRYLIEYADEFITSRISADSNYISTLSERKRFYGLANGVMFQFPKFVSVKYVFVYQPKDQGMFHDVGLKIDIVDRLEANVKYQFFTGAQKSFFKQNWQYNDRFDFNVKYSFESEKKDK